MMRRRLRVFVVVSVFAAAAVLGSPARGRPVAVTVASDPCPGDIDASLNAVPLPPWADLCWLTLETTSVDGSPAVLFTIQLAGELENRPMTASYRVTWHVAQRPDMEWTYNPVEQLRIDSGESEPRPSDRCGQELTFDQTHNKLDHVTGTWRATLWDHTCPTWGVRSRFTEIPPHLVTVGDGRLSILVTSEFWGPQTKLASLTVSTGSGLVAIKGDDTTSPPGIGHLHSDVPLPADEATGRDYAIGK